MSFSQEVHFSRYRVVFREEFAFVKPQNFFEIVLQQVVFSLARVFSSPSVFFQIGMILGPLSHIMPFLIKI